MLIPSENIINRDKKSLGIITKCYVINVMFNNVLPSFLEDLFIQ